jgi:threonine dehydrogenase-like Zn-dependent dehydrogenase
MDKPVSRSESDDAIVKTTRALICTSDSRTVADGIGPRKNLAFGHEAVGIAHDVGGEMKVFQFGDRVLPGAITPDWEIPRRKRGYSSQSGTLVDGRKFSNTKDGYSPSTSM